MIARKIFRMDAWKARLKCWRSLVALAGIVVLTTTLVGRTFEVQLNHRPAVSSSAEKAKIQHRDKQKTRSSPATIAARPFYLLVIEDAVEPEQTPPLSAHVDDCLYNRPPPRS
jgi:anti-sigma-K factor RskA